MIPAQRLAGWDSTLSLRAVVLTHIEIPSEVLIQWVWTWTQAFARVTITPGDTTIPRELWFSTHTLVTQAVPETHLEIAPKRCGPGPRLLKSASWVTTPRCPCFLKLPVDPTARASWGTADLGLKLGLEAAS